MDYSKIGFIVGLVLIFGSVSVIAKVGDLRSLRYGVGGTVYIVDDQRILIKGFSYNGKN